MGVRPGVRLGLGLDRSMVAHADQQGATTVGIFSFQMVMAQTGDGAPEAVIPDPLSGDSHEIQHAAKR